MSRAPALQVELRPRAKDDPTPWLLNIHGSWAKNGRRTRHRFPTKIAGNQFLHEHKKWLADYLSHRTELTVEQKEDAVKALRIGAPYGATLEAAMVEHVDRLKVAADSITLTDLVEALLTDRESKGKRARYLATLKFSLRRWARTFPCEKISEITPEAVETWLKKTTSSPGSWNNERRMIGVALSYAIKIGRLDQSIIKRVDRATVEDAPVEILTVEQCSALLKAANGTPALAMVCFGLFAGIRPAEIERLEWGEVRAGEIRISGATSKTASTGFVTLQPVLQAWLNEKKLVDMAFGRVVPDLYQGRMAMESARKRAGITVWPHDALRRCFASYHYAHFSSAESTARELRHRGTVMLFAHYRGLVTNADAAAYWNLTPANVLT
jgi:integrase